MLGCFWPLQTNVATAKLFRRFAPWIDASSRPQILHLKKVEQNDTAHEDEDRGQSVVPHAQEGLILAFQEPD
jgi:hypothetical protein